MDFIKEAITQNSHWETGKISFPHLQGVLVEREVFGTASKSLERKFITVLRGLRRTGKSFLARQLAKKKLDETSPQQVAWFEFDRAMNCSPDDLDAILSFFQSKGAKTVFLDEIAFVPKWQDVLKRFYDRSELKFVATGSSALEFDGRSAESLAGRVETIDVTPFSFVEKLLLKKMVVPATPLQQASHSQEMAEECRQYLVAGGLPEIANESDEEFRKKYVDKSLLDPLFYKDFTAVFRQANPDMLRKTLELLAQTTGTTFQLQSLAHALGCSHPTAGTQVSLLEKTLLTRVIYNFTQSVAKQKRTAKKIVFADNGILSALKPDAEISRLAENAVHATLGTKFFWRDAAGREVDAIFPEAKTAVEVKYSSQFYDADEKNLRYFLAMRPGWKGLLITKNTEERGDVPKIPLWKILLAKKLP